MKRGKLRIVTLVIIGISIVLLGLGIYRGELKDIYGEGAYICLECIGLGK